jgi:hypothetical protein
LACLPQSSTGATACRLRSSAEATALASRAGRAARPPPSRLPSLRSAAPPALAAPAAFSGGASCSATPHPQLQPRSSSCACRCSSWHSALSAVIVPLRNSRPSNLAAAWTEGCSAGVAPLPYSLITVQQSYCCAAVVPPPCPGPAQSRTVSSRSSQHAVVEPPQRGRAAATGFRKYCHPGRLLIAIVAPLHCRVGPELLQPSRCHPNCFMSTAVSSRLLS